MAEDPLYSEVADWAADELVASSKLNNMNDNTKNHQLYKLHLGGDGTNTEPIKLARLERTFTLTGTTGHNETFTFSTDCLDGDPGFTEAPTVIGATIQNGGSSTGFSPTTLRWYSRSSTGISFRIGYAGWTSPSGFTATLQVGLMGK